MNPLADQETFDGEVFTGLDLTGEDLGARELYGCAFVSCKLGETKWRRTRLEQCRFEGCDLTRADFTMATWHGVELTSCKLMGIDWGKLAVAHDLTLTDCMLRYSSFGGLKLRKLTATRCAVTESTFVDVDLGLATFADCDFRGTLFTRCELKGTRFPSAKGLYIDPRQNKVKGAQIPLEAAILLAHAFEFEVIGFGDDPEA